MNDFESLFESAALLSLELQFDRMTQVADGIQSMEGPNDLGKLQSLSLSGNEQSLLDKLLRDWSKVNRVDSNQLSMILRASGWASRSAINRQTIELAWTGPETEIVPVRRTEEVLNELIEVSEKRLFLIGFKILHSQTVQKALQTALSRGVEVSILVGTSWTKDGLFWKLDIGELRDTLLKAHIYFWQTETQDEEKEEDLIVNAKCIIVDDRHAFITSANPIRPELDKNMEMGILIRGGNIPKNLHDHFHAMIATNILKEIDIGRG